MLLSRRRVISLSALAGIGVLAGTTPQIASAAGPVGPTGVPVEVSGSNLSKYLAELPPFVADGPNRTPIRSIKVTPGGYLIPQTIVVPSGVYLDATGSPALGCAFRLTDSAGTETALLLIKGVTDVTIKGGTWDGNQAIARMVTEWRHAIRIENARAVTVQGELGKNLVATNAKGDGIYVGSSVTPSYDIKLSYVTCTGNHRNGMSITAANGFLAENCSFVKNGSTPPMSGGCIEPNHEAAVIDNIVFTGCSFDNNSDRGFLMKMRVGNNPTTPVIFNRCTFNGNGVGGKNGSLTGGLVLLRPRQITVTGGQITGNQRGIFIQGTRPVPKGVKKETPSPNGLLQLNGVTVSGNLAEGILVDDRIKQITCSGTTISTNSRRSRSSYSNIYLKESTGLKMTKSSAKSSKGYGIRTNKQKSPKLQLDKATYKALSGNKKGRLSKSTKKTYVTA